MVKTSILGYMPIMLLAYIWLVAGLADPTGVFSNFTYLRWLSYPIIFSLGLITIFFVISRGKILKLGFAIYFLIILLIWIASYLLHNFPIKDIIYAFGVYLRYPLFFAILIYLKTTKQQYELFFQFITYLALLLLIEAIVNYLFLGRSGDSTFFTLGVAWGHVSAGIIFLYTSCLVIAHALVKRMSLWHVLFILLIGIASLIASVRTTIIWLPILMVLLLLVNKKLIRPMWVGFFSLIFIAATLLLSFIIPVWWPAIVASFPALEVINPTYRLSYISRVLTELVDINDIFFGSGPRSMNPGHIDNMGYMFDYFYHHADLKHIIDNGTNQFVKAFAEIGAIGFVVYWLMLLRVLLINLQLWKRLQGVSSVDLSGIKILNLAFFGIWLHFSALGLISNDIWRFDASGLIFWVSASYIVFATKKLKGNNLEFR